MLPKKNKKREESAAAHWCFKVCSPCSDCGHFYFMLGLLKTTPKYF
jgi:hypothetical protein